MDLAEYAVETMKQTRGKWSVLYDDNGEPFIVNQHGKICKGVAQLNGNIVTVKTLLEMLEKTES